MTFYEEFATIFGVYFLWWQGFHTMITFSSEADKIEAILEA